LAAALELHVPLRDAEDGARFELLRRFGRGRAPFVLALGTSRTANGLCTDLPSAEKTTLFNYGITGSDLPEQALRLRRLLAAGVRPRGVAIELLPAHLAQSYCRAEDRADRLGWPDVAGSGRIALPQGRLFLRWVRARVVPWFSARSALLSRCLPWLLPEETRLDKYWQGVSESGWRVFGRDRVSGDEYRRGLEIARKRYATLLERFRIRRAPDLAVRDMLAACREEGIPVVLYLMPEATSFRAWYPAETRAELKDYLACLRREFGVRVIDAREWLPDDAFADGHHLLPHGSAAFTARFVREVGEPADAEQRGSDDFPRTRVASP
jgi:hypothetical protein